MNKRGQFNNSKKAQNRKYKISPVSLSSKKAQMQISFGMIFTIILIIVFIAFAFYAIQKFIFFQKNSQYRMFIEDFKTNVDKMWKSPSSSSEVSYRLPSAIKQVCIVEKCSNFGLDYNCYNLDDNLVFNSSKNNFESTYVSNLDIDRILGTNNKLCFDVKNGEVSMILIKEYNSNLVLLAKIN